MEHKHKLMATASSEGEGGGACTDSVMDRFSNLPKEVAHHILSFINVRNLTRFSCVSNRCRELSLSTPSLNFCAFSSAETATCELRLKLLNSLDRFLFQRGNNKIQSFRISWDGHDVDDSDEAPCFCANENFRMVTWIQNAVRCNVEELFLDVGLHDWEDRVPLPSCTFLSASLRSLNVVQLMGMYMKTPSFAFSSNLSCLKLENVDAIDESFFKWISCSCKCIKELSLEEISGIRNITIESSSLERFDFFEPYWSQICHLKFSGEKLEGMSINWVFGSPNDNSLNIFAPNLKTLHWNGKVMNHPNLGELEYLLEASISLEPEVHDFENIFEVLCSVRRVEVLSLYESTFKALFREGSTPVQFDNLFDLDMSIWSFSDELVPALVFLLRGMPNLCTLYISECPRFSDPESDASGFDMEYWKLQNLDFIHHIEEVTVDLFNGTNGIEFARYILENAENLEKMVINQLPEQSDVRQKLNESKMMMMSKATIIFQENQR